MSTQKPIYLYITPFFPSPESWRGGYCLDAVKAIMRDGRYDVRVIAEGTGDNYEWDGIKVHRMRRLVAPCGLVPFLLAPINNLLFRRTLKRMGIKPDDVAVCHANTTEFGHYAAWFKRMNRSATAIIQMHFSYNFSLASGRLGVVPLHASLLYLYYRHVCEKVDILAFVSKMACDTFGKRFTNTPEDDIKDVRSQLLFGRFMRDIRLPKRMVVYNGVDQDLFYPKPRNSHEGFTIGCVANFQPLKDHMTLLKAANILKDKIDGLMVRLMGSGATLQACRKYVADNALEKVVRFEKEVDHRSLPDFYRELDLFVLPSRIEGFGCVYAESLACGTPFICCRDAGIAELVSDEWKIAPLDATELADKILAYGNTRQEQHLKRDLEINGIWREFMDEIGRPS